MAIFDNAQVRHAWSPGAYKLVFAPAVTGAPPDPPMTPATSGMPTATTCKACHGATGPGPTMPSLPDHSSFGDTRAVCTTCHNQEQ